MRASSIICVPAEGLDHAHPIGHFLAREVGNDKEGLGETNELKRTVSPTRAGIAKNPYSSVIVRWSRAR